MFIQRSVTDALDAHFWCQAIEECGWTFVYLFTEPRSGMSYIGASHPQATDVDSVLVDRAHARFAYPAAATNAIVKATLPPVDG